MNKHLPTGTKELQKNAKKTYYEIPWQWYDLQWFHPVGNTTPNVMQIFEIHKYLKLNLQKYTVNNKYLLWKKAVKKILLVVKVQLKAYIAL